MKINISLVVLFSLFGCSVRAQQLDSMFFELNNVVITAETLEQRLQKSLAQPVSVADKQFLQQHFTGNLMQSLEYVPGVRSMDVGSGFSKPMIRGLGFNRVVVSENGIKQEGQQWGADHGLEIDAFGINKVVVYKGPQALQYGSDAMGGAIEIAPPTRPYQNSVLIDLSLLGKSINDGIGGSIMLGLKKDSWLSLVRYSEQRFGDYRIPTDSIVYLTLNIPIYNRRVKNTAGMERNVYTFNSYKKGDYEGSLMVSNVYQKMGFFPGAHGIPDIGRVEHDGNYRNIELPYSKVNHFKVNTQHQYNWDTLKGTLTLGYQNNRRQEWSAFHTHYGTQQPPERNPDKEFDFNLNTYSADFKVSQALTNSVKLTYGADGQYQQNRIDGYSFLLPKYNRMTAGGYLLVDWELNDKLSISGGVRYDYGRLNISGYQDEYLAEYLKESGYTPDKIEQYEWRSYPTKRDFKDISGSIGAVWKFSNTQVLKANIGKSFRLPGAFELASNGVHHGTFRHEQGNPNLDSEKGWQFDLSYHYDTDWLRVNVSPYINRFGNYIYLRPTGEWSILPHAGQIYKYTGSKVLFAGLEVAADVDFLKYFNYSTSFEYVYTHNEKEHTPLNFTPPTVFRNSLSFEHNNWKATCELHSILKQTRIARNEQITDGANLINLYLNYQIPIHDSAISIALAARNIFNTKYYNHLSFYRKVEIPEPGRNIQISINVPLNIKLR